jgi:hypothetical protein
MYHRPFGLLVIAGAVVSVYIRARLAIVFAVLALAPIGMNLLHVFPLLPGRHSLIMMPALAYFASLGVSVAVENVGGWSRVGGIIAVVMLCMVSTVRAGLEPFGQQGRQLVNLVQDHLSQGDPIVVTMGSQPLIDAYLNPAPRQSCNVGLKNVLGWTNRCSIRRDTVDSLAFTGPQTPWFVMNYIAHQSLGFEVRNTEVSMVEQWRQSYFQFVLGQSCKTSSALIAIIHLGPVFVEELRGVFTKSGTITDVLDEWRRRYLTDGRVLEWHRSTDGAACGLVNLEQ